MYNLRKRSADTLYEQMNDMTGGRLEGSMRVRARCNKETELINKELHAARYDPKKFKIELIDDIVKGRD